jgi:hypothetical protein
MIARADGEPPTFREDCLSVKVTVEKVERARTVCSE